MCHRLFYHPLRRPCPRRVTNCRRPSVPQKTTPATSSKESAFAAIAPQPPTAATAPSAAAAIAANNGVSGKGDIVECKVTLVDEDTTACSQSAARATHAAVATFGAAVDDRKMTQDHGVRGASIKTCDTGCCR